MRGTIDWSYSLLSVEEQILYARLSIFAGGCTFEAAESVCASDRDLDLLDGIASLVDKSLVRQEGEEEPRYSMLETIREYAQEKLAEQDGCETIGRHHAQYFLDLAEQAGCFTGRYPLPRESPRLTSWESRHAQMEPGPDDLTRAEELQEIAP